MKLFGQIIRTAVNVVTLPVAVLKDAATLGGAANGHGSYISEALDELKREASEDEQ